MAKRIAILGSTGSIGCNALEVIEHLGGSCRAVALSANRNVSKLIEQMRKHQPTAVCVGDSAIPPELSREAEKAGTKIHHGEAGLLEMVRRNDIDTVLAAIVGAAGLKPVLAAIEAGKHIALANKESLVVGGSLVISAAQKRGVSIMPVDSEHSAVFQSMQAGRAAEIQRVILTASGGPFRCAPAHEIEAATLSDALKHPTWQMGSKITIDSATMFNKALEIIEACWLFDLPPEKIEVVIHPESVIHSMVEYVDGSVIAQLSPPDMRTPIQYALTWPDRQAGIGRRLDLRHQMKLNFEPPDMQRFPALRLGYEAARRRGTAGAILNAANETAVAAFINGRIRFGMIWRIVELTMNACPHQDGPTLEDLLEADRAARVAAERLISDDKSRTLAV